MSKGYKAEIISIDEKEMERFQDFHRGKEKKKVFITHLISVKGLFGRNGVQLCTTQIAKALGVSAQSIMNYIKELMSLKYLECVDKGYVIKKKSRTYKNLSGKLFELFDKYCNKIKDQKLIKLVKIKLKIRKKQIKALRDINKKDKISYRDCYKLAKLYKGFHKDYINDVQKYVDDRHLLTMARDVNPRKGWDSRGFKTFYYALKNVYKFCGLIKKFTVRDFRGIIIPYDDRQKDGKHSPTSKVIGYKEFRGYRSSKLENMLAIA
jgi:hypothetical protein